ncbi:MAG: MBL fold metallo-hydrolase [Anaerovoracaceae bacterium]
MAWLIAELVENITEALNGRPLDYVVLSHTHYDHIGALPYVRRAWPQVKVYGAAHGKEVLSRPGALKMMTNLGIAAEEQYGEGNPEKVLTQGLAIDCILGEGDILSLGKTTLVTLEAKGHTDCSLAFVLEPEGIMISNETTGVLEGEGKMHTAILKSFEDAMVTLEKCRSYGARRIISPHYGMVPEEYNEAYWALFEKEAREEKDFVTHLWCAGLTEKERLAAYVEKYWEEERIKEVPRQAFIVNAKCTLYAERPSVDECKNK